MPRVDWLKGVYPAIVTPFKKDESMDEDTLRKLIEYQIKDVNGFVVAGTTGEFVYLTDEERMRSLEIVIDQVAGRVPVIAGTGASSTRGTVDLTRKAKDLVAKAALVVTPYYFNPTWKEIY